MTENTTIDRIVVGVDGSEASKAAVQWAAFLAASLSCRVDAVAAWQVPVAAGFAVAPTDYDPAADMAATVERTVAAVLGASPSVQVTTMVREGGAAHVLIQAAQGARMLVVGSRGLGGFSGLLLGSVSTACASHARCPVLVIHGSTPPPPVTV